MKRFYKDVAVVADGNGWRVTLDGRTVKTQGKKPQVVPTRALAEAMAEEWARQGDEIDANAFPLRDLADFAIDMGHNGRDALAAEITIYAETDTLCYRADPGEPLHERQMAMWEPILMAAEHRWDAHFERISGVVHRPQPAETLARMRAAVAALDTFTLAALRMLTGLSASLVIGLAAIQPEADAEALWAAASLEEDWQAELWGRDAEAEAVRKARFEAFALGIRFVALAGGRTTAES